jgi:Ca2+-binding EF-hand superfamily protein
MKCLLYTCAAVLLLASPAVSSAQETSDQSARLIANQAVEMQDRDGDGRISVKESVGAALTLFNAIDADHDGRVTREEMLTVARNDVVALRVSNTDDQTAALVASRFTSMDIDGDGLISLPEMMAVSQTLFDAADGNADGYVSKAEMLVFATTRSAQSENN